MIYFDNNLNNTTVSYQQGIDKIVDIVEDIAVNCEDFNVELNTIEMEQKGNLFMLADNSVKEWQISELAMTQLCDKIRVPFRYFTENFNSVDIDEKNLAIHNINIKTKTKSRIKKNQKGLFVRTYKDIIRAILTTRYTDFTQDKILSAVNTTIKKNSYVKPEDLTIRGHIATPEFFHIRITENTPINIENNNYYCGLAITASDVGLSAIKIDFFVFDEKNQTTLVFNQNGDKTILDKALLYKRHRGNPIEAVIEGIESALQCFNILVDRTKYFLKSKENVKVDMSKIFVEDNKSPLKQLFADKLNIKIEEVDKIAAINQGHKTLLQISQDIAEYAKTKPFKERERLEALAGQMLTDFLGLHIEIL